jgi:hypothetical protein
VGESGKRTPAAAGSEGPMREASCPEGAVAASRYRGQVTSTAAFIRALRASADEAVSEGQNLRLVLKGSEVLEGIPASVRIDASKAPASITPESEHHRYGAVEYTIRVGRERGSRGRGSNVRPVPRLTGPH